MNDWLTISASALATIINEDVKEGGSAGNHRKLTPYISASFKPFAKYITSDYGYHETITTACVA